MNQPFALARLRQLAPWALVLFSAVAVVAVYLQALDYPFISDDVDYIATNTRLSTLPLAELWRLFSQPYNNASEFLPLRELSYWLDMTLFGLTPAAFRLHNIVLYLLCLPLVYGITLGLWRLFRPAGYSGDAVANASWAAATVTALFALNPSHVEAVVWISGRKDVLSGLFSLLAFWLALRVKREQDFSAPYATAALLALLAAMLSKATAVAVAPVIALLWLIFWRDIPAPDRRHTLLLWPLAGLLLAACGALVFASVIATRIPFYFGIEVVTRSFAILGWLVRLALSPGNRHFIYPVFEDPWLPAMVLLGVAITVAAAIGGVLILRKHSRYSHYSLEGFALVTFFLLCLPYMQLIPYAPPSLVSDRFVFLAAWPVALLVVILSWRLSAPPRVALLLAIALSWGIQTAERPRDWRSFEALVEADWHAYPGNYILALYEIFFVPSQQGFYPHAFETANSITVPEFRDEMIKLVEADYAVRVRAVSTGKPQEAMALLRQWGLDLRHPPVQARWNSPIHNLWRRRETLLMREWEYLAEHFSDDETVRYSAGLGLLELQRFGSAAVHLRAAIESRRLHESERGTAFYSLGLALMRSGQVAAAEVPLYAALIQSPPDLRAYCLFTEVYQQTGRFEDAARAKADCSGLAPNAGSLQ